MQFLHLFYPHNNKDIRLYWNVRLIPLVIGILFSSYIFRSMPHQESDLNPLFQIQNHHKTRQVKADSFAYDHIHVDIHYNPQYRFLIL